MGQDPPLGGSLLLETSPIFANFWESLGIASTSTSMRCLLGWIWLIFKHLSLEKRGACWLRCLLTKNPPKGGFFWVLIKHLSLEKRGACWIWVLIKHLSLEKRGAWELDKHLLIKHLSLEKRGACWLLVQIIQAPLSWKERCLLVTKFHSIKHLSLEKRGACWVGFDWPEPT